MPTRLTTSDVANLLGISTARVRVLAAQGRLGAEKFGKVWSFDSAEVIDYSRTRKAGRPWKEKR